MRLAVDDYADMVRQKQQTWLNPLAIENNVVLFGGAYETILKISW